PEGFLMRMHAVRIPVPRAEELRADVSELLPLIAPPGREPARTMAVLARQPDLLSPFLGWAAALALTGVLPHRDHELLALRVASNCGSEFEWVEHAEYTRAAGLADDEVAMVARSIDEGTWSDVERALLSVADEIHNDCAGVHQPGRCIGDPGRRGGVDRHAAALARAACAGGDRRGQARAL